MQIMQECFESQDIGALQDAIAAMPVEDARYHMKRCVDSGLWKPASDDPNTNPEDGFKRREAAAAEEGEEEPVYEEPKEVAGAAAAAKE